MIETRLIVTRRPALAIPPVLVKAPLTTARKAKRNIATMKDPRVRSRRTFLRNKLALMSRQNFMPHLPRRHRAGTWPPPPAHPFQDAGRSGRGLPPGGRA